MVGAPSALLTCPTCGNRTPGAANFCAQCGAPLGSLRTLLPGPSQPNGPSRWVWVVIAVGIALVLVLPGLGAYFLDRGLPIPTPPPQAPLELQFSGPSCLGWSNELSQIPVDGGKVWMSFLLNNQEPSGSCTAKNVSVLNLGFAVLSSNTPVIVGAGTYGSLNLTLDTPSVMPVGDVTLVVSVSQP